LISSAPGEVVKPGDMKTVEELGLPLMQTPYKFGNLFIYFEIDFPMTL
jgi:DnaJ-class molecular chaperone